MELDKGKAIKNNGTYYKECQHDCTEKKIGYECVCNEGYELAPDKHSCTGRTLTGFIGFAQVTKQVHIPMNLLTLLFITVIFRVYYALVYNAHPQSWQKNSEKTAGLMYNTRPKNGEINALKLWTQPYTYTWESISRTIISGIIIVMSLIWPPTP